MPSEVDGDGNIKEIVQVPALIFVNHETGDSLAAEVHDKWPAMGDFHIEGRRYVEVTVEMFDYMMTALGWELQKPGQNEDTEGETDGTTTD